MTRYTVVPSPIGPLLLTANAVALSGVYMCEPGDNPPALDAGPAAWGLTATAGWVRDETAPPLQQAREQLAAYFAGHLREFDVPLDAAGSLFQQRVWAALRAIPYGTTISYGELARRIGNPKSARAVGLANGSNPLAIIVPCHRVIGANGRLTGYGGGLPRKAALLDFEGAVRLAGPLPFEPL